jgi:hypothetical protein
MLVKAIVERLKTGTIKNIVPFANSMKIPPPPYAVVKPEVGAVPGTRQFRVIAHVEQGRMEELEKYVFTELPELLLTGKDGQKVRLKDGDGRVYRLRSGDWTDVRPDGEGGTICMERIFYIPFKIA